MVYYWPEVTVGQYSADRGCPVVSEFPMEDSSKGISAIPNIESTGTVKVSLALAT